MTTISSEEIKTIAKGAERHLSEYNETQLIDIATDLWIEADAEVFQTRPIKMEIREFLKDVVRAVLKNISKKNREITAVTLTFATERLIECLINEFGWTFFDPYLIPLEILSAVVYTEILKTITKTIKD